MFHFDKNESLVEDDFLKKTYIKKSNIPSAGNGRFFADNCKSGTIIRVQSIERDLIKINNIDEISNIDINLIHNFAHSKTITNNSSESDVVYINKQPLFTNHSNDNNISFQYINDRKITYTTKNVKKNDELLQNYCEYTRVHWFEDYLKTIGKFSLRELGMKLKMAKEVK